MPAVRDKGSGGLVQRHDHPTCPPLVDGVRPDHRCKGRWAGTLDVEIDGRTKRKYVYAKTQRAARLKLEAALREKADGTIIIGTKTVEKWLAEWMEKRRQPPKPLKPNTWNGYESKIRLYILPALGGRRLTQLRAPEIDALYASMRARGLKEATVRQTHAILQKALKDAVRKGHLGRSPMDRVDAPGTETADRDQFTLDQAHEALRAAGDSARWWLALFYGMRQGEVLGMDWRFVYWGLSAFAIEETRQNDYGYGKAIRGTPKAKASTRTLPMVPQIEIRLRLLWESAGRPTEGLTFPSRDGGLRDSKADWQDWSDFIEEAGLPHIALHAARNTASSLMEAAGIPDRVVAQILGQAEVRTTHRYQAAELERVRAYLNAAALNLGPLSSPSAGTSPRRLPTRQE